MKKEQLEQLYDEITYSANPNIFWFHLQAFAKTREDFAQLFEHSTDPRGHTNESVFELLLHQTSVTAFYNGFNDSLIYIIKNCDKDDLQAALNEKIKDTVLPDGRELTYGVKLELFCKVPAAQQALLNKMSPNASKQQTASDSNSSKPRVR